MIKYIIESLIVFSGIFCLLTITSVLLNLDYSSNEIVVHCLLIMTLVKLCYIEDKLNNAKNTLE